MNVCQIVKLYIINRILMYIYSVCFTDCAKKYYYMSDNIK